MRESIRYIKLRDGKEGEGEGGEMTESTREALKAAFTASCRQTPRNLSIFIIGSLKSERDHQTVVRVGASA